MKKISKYGRSTRDGVNGVDSRLVTRDRVKGCVRRKPMSQHGDGSGHQRVDVVTLADFISECLTES